MAVNETLNLTIKNTISEISVSVISIPEDRLENILIKHVKKIERSKDFIGSSGLFIALVTTFVTSEFKDVGLASETWKGIFIVALIVSFIYMVRVIWNCIKNRVNVDKIMSDIKSAKSEMCYAEKQSCAAEAKQNVVKNQGTQVKRSSKRTRRKR